MNDDMRGACLVIGAKADPFKSHFVRVLAPELRTRFSLSADDSLDPCVTWIDPLAYAVDQDDSGGDAELHIGETGAIPLGWMLSKRAHARIESQARKEARAFLDSLYAASYARAAPLVDASGTRRSLPNATVERP